MNRVLKSILTGVTAAAISLSALAHDHGKKYGDKKKADNIVEVASNAGTFNTLLAAAKAAGLAPTLSNDGPFTVFAPTDEAFAALPAGTIDSLLKEENKAMLTRILTYHVVPGKVGSGALANDISVETVAGPEVTFTEAESGFTIEGARIIATDIDASNGVVHVIDRVIMPPEPLSRVDAEQMIMAAINKGAPMFNHGNHQGTVALYDKALSALANRVELNPMERQRISGVMAELETLDSNQTRAWAMRYALDDVMMSLQKDRHLQAM